MGPLSLVVINVSPPALNCSGHCDVSYPWSALKNTLRRPYGKLIRVSISCRISIK
jgi:hypothetical protein